MEMEMEMEMTDFRVFYDGSVSLVTPETPAAHEWLSEHVPADAPWFGDALAVEPRFLDALIDGIEGDGLAVTPARPPVYHS